MMPPQLIKLLSQATPGKFHDELLRHVKDLVTLSRGEMEKNYDKWDMYDLMWRGKKDRDTQDVKASERKEPEKLCIPISYSQIETFVAFCNQVFTQRPTFYELSASGTEDIQAAKVAESVLEHNLNYNNFKGDKLQQFLRNIGRFGIGIIKHSWDQKTCKVEQMVPMPMQVAPGMPQPINPPMMSQLTDVVSYQGNIITVVSPYRFFPDPRVPITRFQEGEFCASEDDYGKHQLRRLERQGIIAGLEHIKPFKTEVLTDSKRKFNFAIDTIGVPGVNSGATQNFYTVTEVEVELIPSEWDIEGTPLGSSDEPEKYVVWYANDNRLIRIEPKNYLHNEFNYDVSQFTNDNLQYINGGLGEILAQLQDVQNWLINSHITSVRKVISNMLIVDPKGVEMKDLDDRKPIIRLKPTVQGSGVERWIKQLNVQDVTQNHIADAGVMANFGKETTGITENLLGQFASGRRSATEARNVSSNAAARLLLTAISIWGTALLPLARKLLSNCRDGMDIPQLVKAIGASNVQNNQFGVQQFITADKTQLVGNYDFLPFDGTLPSQRGAVAQVLQELLSVMMARPESAFLFQLDPTAILLEMLHLRGIRNVDQFRLSPDKAQQLVGLAAAAKNATAVANAGGGGQRPPGNSA